MWAGEVGWAWAGAVSLGRAPGWGLTGAFPCHSPAAGDSPCDGTELSMEQSIPPLCPPEQRGCGLWGLDGGTEALGLSGATAEQGLLGLCRIFPFISPASSKIRLERTVLRLGRENKEGQARPPRTRDNFSSWLIL